VEIVPDIRYRREPAGGPVNFDERVDFLCLVFFRHVYTLECC
jgi:hypothetical protein